MLHPMMDSSLNPDGTPDLSVYRDLTDRLNKHARRILLLAPGPDEEPVVIPPLDAKPSTATSHYQAIRRLEERALVFSELVEVWITIRRSKSEFEWNQVLGEWITRRVPSQQRRRKVAVKLTPVGAAVVAEMRSLWENEAVLPPAPSERQDPG